GTVVGAVTGRSANIFARTDVRGTVQIEYSTDPAFTSVTKSVAKKSQSTSDFTATLALSGLAPETTYYYRVVVDKVAQQSSPYPSFRTFPPAGAPREFAFAAVLELEQTH